MYLIFFHLSINAFYVSLGNLEYRESPDELTSHVPLHLLDDGIQSLNLHYYVHHVVRYHSLQSHL